MKYYSKSEALAKAQKYCAYQERSHSEVRNKLLQLGQRGKDLEDIMATLIENGFLNEERFAIAYTGGKFRIKHWGKNKIVQQLKLKNISEYSIRRSLKEINDKDYTSALQELIEKKWKSLTEKNNLIKKNKVARYCIGRGYESELVWSLLESKKAN
jgi:regulatory protein